MLIAKVIEAQLPPIADPALVRLAVAGNPDAFSEIYLRYVKRITALVGRMLRRSSECEEVTQEVFLQIHLSLPRFEGRSSFYTWVFRLATNVVLHHIRAAARRRLVSPLDGALEARLASPAWLAGTSPERDAAFNALLKETTRVIDQLLPSLRDVMILGPLNGHTPKEMAAILGVNTDVIKSRLHRARVSVRQGMWRNEPRIIPLIGIHAPIPSVLAAVPTPLL